MQTPKATHRATPLTGPRAPTKPRPVTYSAAPLCTIDENTLVSSRFINPTARRLAYRDASGRVNLNLCKKSLAISDRDLDSESEIRVLITWTRHANRAIASRDVEELSTLDALVAEEDAAAYEKLPISLRKPKRAAVSAMTDFSPTPDVVDRSHPETVVVLPPPMARRLQPQVDGEFQEDEDDEDDRVVKMHRVAPHTVSMQRRLFRLPEPGDEPCHLEEEVSIDQYYVRALTEQAGRRRKAASSSDDDEQSDVYEVGAILQEREGRFLIRWEGFAPEDDSWEPEENVAHDLVKAYREKQRRMTRHVGDDYVEGRTRMLWCHTCAEHRPADCYSAAQRRSVPSSRCCLNHHYRIEGVPLPKTPEAVASERKAMRTSGKRTRDDDTSPRPPPLPPRAAAVGRTADLGLGRELLSSRDADREVARCRLYGFSS